MKIETFKNKAEKLLGKVEDLFSSMPDKGNTPEESQKICLIQALKEVFYTVNGTTQEDLETEN